jgi:predicted acetyltransferase
MVTHSNENESGNNSSKLWHKSNTINTEQMTFVQRDALYCVRLGSIIGLINCRTQLSGG